MPSALMFVGSTGLAKLLPLLFGLLLSSLVGLQSYVHFVQILAQANFLTTLATVSYTQMILSSRPLENPRNTQELALSALVFSAIVSTLGGLWAASAMFASGPCTESGGCQATSQTGLCVALYAFGNAVLMIQMSQFNARLRGARAGFLLLCGLSASYTIGATYLVMTNRGMTVLTPIAVTLSSVALAAFWLANRTYLATLKIRSFGMVVARSLPKSREHGCIMLFAALILYAHAHALSAVSAANGHALAATFSLGYQLFAIGLFVPGVLGNLVVPLLGRNRLHSAQGPRSIAAAYLAISLASMAVVQVFGSYILLWYGLEPSNANRSILLTLQLAVVFASLNALINQRLAAERQYRAMAGLSIIYLLTLLLAGYITGHEAASVAYGIVVSYLVTLAIGIAVIRHSRIIQSNRTGTHESDADFWSARAKRYGHTGWTNQAIYHYDQALRLKLVQDVVKRLNIFPGSKCLDFGCGTGDFTRMLSGMGLQVLGYDLSGAVIDVARRRGEPSIARFSTNANDLSTYGPYHLVLAVTVFQHILDDATLYQTIQYVSECMEVGGHLILIESSVEGKQQSAHVRGRTRAAWRDAFKANGLSLCLTKSLYHPTLQPTPSFKAYRARPIVRLLRVATHFGFPLANRVLRRTASRAVQEDCDYFVEGDSPVVLMVWRK